jgi:chromosome segregation ATPase
MIAMRYAERQLQAEGSSRVQLEEKIAELEQQKKTLQEALGAEQIRDASAHTEVDAAIEVAKTLESQIKEAQTEVK